MCIKTKTSYYTDLKVGAAYKDPKHFPAIVPP